MKFRSTKAAGSFDCAKEGAFEILVHMEGDPRCHSCAEFDVALVLPSKFARELDDVATYLLRHRAGLFVVGAEPARASRSAAYRYCWRQLDAALARRNIWLVSARAEELRREPKWSRALQLAQSAQSNVEPADQDRVVAYLSEVGQATLRSCLKLCGAGPDSFDAIIGLIARGVLYSDPSGDLALDSDLRLDPPPTVKSAATGWLADCSKLPSPSDSGSW